jgi:hypothetical protein
MILRSFYFWESNDTSTPHGYAHLADDPVKDASERIGDALAEAMKKRPPSDPSPQKS